MQVFAHRGNSSEAPENTLAAFRSAQAVGAAGLEFDVQLSRDGAPVVIHDERLERTTTGQGWVRERTQAELMALDAGAWFGAPFQGQRMPLLAELLEAFRGSGMVLNLEIKTNRVAYPGLVPAIVGEIRRLKMERQMIVSSFNHQTLLEVRALDPALECAPIVYENLIEPWDYARRHGFASLHPHHFLVDERLMEGCRKAGVTVRAWTVDDVPTAQRLKQLGVDAAITNRPRELLAALK